MRTHLSIFLVAMLASSFVFAAEPPSSGRKLAEESRAAAERVLTNQLAQNEIDMILYRREMMGRVGLLLYVVFLTDTGAPLEYFASGKCTSSGKRLTKDWEFKRGQTGVDSEGHSVSGDFVMKAPDIDGTHGESTSYIYCKTVDGKYKQWNGLYYISDAPIELTIKPIIVSGITTPP